MCGIVGVVSAFSNGLSQMEANIFQDMLFLDTLRGWDSTGVFAVDKLGNVQIHKAAMHGPDFLTTKEWADTRTEAIRRGKIVVGHNRAATRGEVTDVNAHPFVVKDELVLVHNGSMRGSHKHLADVAVDSEAIAIHLEKNADVEKALQEVDSAYALAWYRVSNKSLNIIRNNERPLWMVKSAAGAYIFASEMETILYACSRNQLKLDAKVEMVPAHVLTEISLVNGGAVNFKTTKLDAAYRPKVQPPGNSFPRRYTHGELDEDDFSTVTQLFPRRQRTFSPEQAPFDYDADDNTLVIGKTIPRSAKDISFPFVDWAVDNLEEQQIPGEETQMVYNALTEARINRKDKDTFIVETVDYMKANNHPRCRAWIVYGSILTHEADADISRAIVYWFVYDLPEEDMIQYTTRGFYKVRTTTTQMRNFLNNKNKRVGLVCAFGVDAKYYPISSALEEDSTPTLQ
jgi:hypothetical protein